MPDEFEPINIEGQQQTGIWVHHPGSNVSQTWEPRKREGRRPELEVRKEDNDSMNSPGSIAAGSGQCDSSSESDNPARNKLHPLGAIKRGLQKIGSVFQRSPRNVKGPINERLKNIGEVAPSPHINVHAIGEKEVGVKLVYEDDNSGAVLDQKSEKEHGKKEIVVNYVLDDGNSGAIEDRKSDKENGEKEIGVNFVSDNNNSGPVEDQKSGEGSLIREKGDAGIPSKGRMRGILKQAGRSAQSLKHTLSRKDTYKSNEVPKPSAVTTADISVKDSLSSSEECSPSEEISIESSSAVGSNKESPSHNEETVETVSSASPRVIKEPAVRKVSFQGEVTDANVAVNRESLANKIVSSQEDAKRAHDDVEGHTESPDRKVCNQGSGGTDDATADHTIEHGKDVPPSFSLNIPEETSEGK